MSKTQAVFSPKLEKFNLFLPSFFILFVIWEYWTAKTFSTAERSVTIYLIKVLCLSHVHVYFTFALLLFFPEGRKWTRHSLTDMANNTFYFWMKITLVFCFFLGISILLTSPQKLNPWFLKLTVYLLLMYSIYHALWQTYGISRMYKSSKPTEVYEKYMAHFIFGIAALQGALRALPNAKEFELFSYLSLFSILAFTRLLYLIYQENKVSKSNKIYFVSRYIFFILTPFFFSAAVTTSALH